MQFGVKRFIIWGPLSLLLAVAPLLAGGGSAGNQNGLLQLVDKHEHGHKHNRDWDREHWDRQDRRLYRRDWDDRYRYGRDYDRHHHRNYGDRNYPYRYYRYPYNPYNNYPYNYYGYTPYNGGIFGGFVWR
jgi:hypothetical protein